MPGRRLLITLMLGVALVSGAGRAGHTCNSDPDCNHGRGSVAGYVCIRSEVNTLGNEGNGRICEADPEGDTWYVYLRALTNREWVIVCHDGELVLSAPGGSTVDHCAIVQD